MQVSFLLCSAFAAFGVALATTQTVCGSDTECDKNEVCQITSPCTKGICHCRSGYKRSDSICKKIKGVGAFCATASFNDDCLGLESDTGECSDGFCSCKTGAHPEGNICVKDTLVSGEPCGDMTVATCEKPWTCVNGKCGCENEFYNPSTCEGVGENGECTTTKECVSTMECIESYCLCPESELWDPEHGCTSNSYVLEKGDSCSATSGTKCGSDLACGTCPDDKNTFICLQSSHATSLPKVIGVHITMLLVISVYAPLLSDILTE